jgi:hypothetical protein
VGHPQGRPRRAVPRLAPPPSPGQTPVEPPFIAGVEVGLPVALQAEGNPRKGPGKGPGEVGPKGEGAIGVAQGEGGGGEAQAVALSRRVGPFQGPGVGQGEGVGGPPGSPPPPQGGEQAKPPAPGPRAQGEAQGVRSPQEPHPHLPGEGALQGEAEGGRALAQASLQPSLEGVGEGTSPFGEDLNEVEGPLLPEEEGQLQEAEAREGERHLSFLPRGQGEAQGVHPHLAPLGLGQVDPFGHVPPVPEEEAETPSVDLPGDSRL